MIDKCPRCLRVGFAFIAIIAFAPMARATFSVVVADQRTGEIAFGSVTCLAQEDVMALVPVVVVGKGAGAVQAFGDGDGLRRPIIFDGFEKGTTPGEILAALAMVPGHAFRQYGIVETVGAPMSFTGPSTSRWRGGVAGVSGSLSYAIQGNVLAGECVVLDMETAIVKTPGDLPARLMAAMQAAFEAGGDGRCSCEANDPDGCDCPPESFEKVGHIGAMLVARIGDTDDEECDLSGCADGDYFLRLNVAYQDFWDEDPVQQLQMLYSLWRTDLVGRPDALRSSVSFEPSVIPANGVSTTLMRVGFRDWRGVIVNGPFADLAVEHAPGSAGVSTIDAVIDNGDGTAIVKITAGAGAGVDRFRVVVDDGVRPVTLMPDPALEYFRLGDIDGDGNVGTLDILEILVAWGECPPSPAPCPADLDANGIVGFGDLLGLLQNWG